MAGGRPSKYRDEMIDQAYRLALLGAKDTDIAGFFEINIDTLAEWKKNKPEFSYALKEGKAKADSIVAESLYNRAIGYEYIEEQAIKVKRGQHNEEVEVVEVRRVIPPDPTSCIFWLKNRQKEQWRDKQEMTLDGNITVNIAR